MEKKFEDKTVCQIANTYILFTPICTGAWGFLYIYSSAIVVVSVNEILTYKHKPYAHKSMQNKIVLPTRPTKLWPTRKLHIFYEFSYPRTLTRLPSSSLSMEPPLSTSNLKNFTNLYAKHSFISIIIFTRQHYAIKMHKFVSGLADFLDFWWLVLRGPAHQENDRISA